MSGVAHFFVVVGGSKIHERLAHFFIDIYSLISFLTQSMIFILSRNVDYTEFSAVSANAILKRATKHYTVVIKPRMAD